MSKKNAYDGSNIQVFEGCSAIRKRPSMYVSSVTKIGVIVILREVTDNSLDEIAAGYGKELIITFHKDNSLTVEDFGRGIPIDINKEKGISTLELLLTTLHAGGKFDKSSYSVSSGLNGVGVTCTNALSEFLEAEVVRDGKLYKQRYAQGTPTSKVAASALPKNIKKKSGTKIHFKPDPIIFRDGEDIISVDDVFEYYDLVSFINPGVKVVLNDEISAKVHTLYQKDGITALLKRNIENANATQLTQIRKFEVSESYERKSASDNNSENIIQAVEVVLSYTTDGAETLKSYVNGIYMKEGGSHEMGFRMALATTVGKYIDKNKDKFLKTTAEKALKITGEDTREGLFGVIKLSHSNPEFVGQHKSSLGNKDSQGLLMRLVNTQFLDYLDRNPAEAEMICKRVILAAKGRLAAKKAREDTRKSPSAFDFTNTPSKLSDCDSSDQTLTELYVIEGDSASGNLKKARDRLTQAVYPLKGVPQNVWQMPVDKVLKNDEFGNLISNVFKIDINLKNYEKNKYGKIVLACDADADGKHIEILLLGFFWKFYPELLLNGHIYLANPPLFRLRDRNNDHYIQTKKDILEFALNKFTIQDKKLKKFISKHYLVLEEINKAVAKLKVPINVFTHLVYSIEEGNKAEIIALLESAFAYELIGKHTVRFVNEEGFLQVVNISEIFIDEIVKCYNWLVDNEIDIDITDALETYFKLNERLQKSYEVTRFKGLGEMNEAELADVILIPETRQLYRVEIDDQDEFAELLERLLGSDTDERKKIINDIKVVY